MGAPSFTTTARTSLSGRDMSLIAPSCSRAARPSRQTTAGSYLASRPGLAWKLAAEIHGWVPAGLLDTYHDERHFAGARTLLHTQAQVALRRGNREHTPPAYAVQTAD